MRLKISCQDWPRLINDLLDSVNTHAVGLRGMDVSASQVYLHFTPIDLAVGSQLLLEIRQAAGVIDVQEVSYMPSERTEQSMLAMFAALSDPVIFLNLKGEIELVNPAVLSLFSQTESTMLQSPIHQWLGDVPVHKWLESTEQVHRLGRRLKGREFLIEAKPIWLPEERDESQRPIGVVIVIKSTNPVSQPLSQPTLTGNTGFEHFIGASRALRQLIHQAQKLAMHDAPLLLLGETGTGKDMLARASHLVSSRRDAPFLALNCAGLPDDVAETELYGCSAGAYPNALESKKGFFEQARGGTVLLDEIAEMSPRMQSKLLRFLNDGTFRRVGEESEVHVDVRVICSTQKNLQQLVAKGVFRQDLFYRLNVLSLLIPPLRERREDILPLTHYFINKFAQELGIMPPLISPAFIDYLKHYNWPGNVRELKNSLYRSMTQLESSELVPEALALPFTEKSAAGEILSLEGSLDQIISKHERAVLTHLYSRYPSTRKLAKRLGVSHTAIANKLRGYGLNRKHMDGEPPAESKINVVGKL